MENTCNEKCHLWKKYGINCPNYIESWWTFEDKKKPILIKDCAPKRTFLMIQELYNRLVGLQQASEQQRNNAGTIIDLTKIIMSQHIKKLVGIENDHIK
jgi:hypothetical protein